MKKFLVTLILLGMFLVMIPFNSDAQTRRPSFYRRHRNAVNIAAGTGAGLILGGLIGGRRGAGVGAIAGAAGSGLYTYKIKPKRRRY